MPSNLQVTKQVSFAGGLNAVRSPHLLADDEVQSSTNVDYSLEWGAASARRGSLRFSKTPAVGTHTRSQHINLICRNYGLSTGTWDDDTTPWFAAEEGGGIYVGDFGGANLAILNTWTNGGSQTQVIPAFSQYNNYLYIAAGTAAIKTTGAGSSTFDWLMPQADTPTVTLTPQWAASPAFVGFAGTTGTYTAVEGSITGTSTTTAFGSGAPVINQVCTTGTGSRIVLVGTCTTTNWENPIPFVTLPTGTSVTLGAGTYTLGGAIDFHQGYPGGDINGTYTGTATITQTLTLGNYGTDYLLITIPDQQSCLTIQRDLSIGDTTFTNYWHSETTPLAIADTTIDPVSAFLESQGNATQGTQAAALNSGRAQLPHVGVASSAGNVPVIRRSIGKISVSATASPWGVSRSDYQFIGVLSSPDFTNIKAVRITLEFNTTGKSAGVSGVATFGGLGYPLNDQAGGISYYQTFARVENGFIVAEGAPSLPSTPQRCQFAHAELVCTSNTNTTAGITHRVFYRTGGFLNDGYRIGSATITSGTATIYDYALPDMLVISNPLLRRNLWSTWPSPSAGTGLPGVNAISLPWQQRVWVGVRNQLYWSVPGVPSQIQDDSQTTVGDLGDNISSIIPAQNLIVVNQNSIFEMAGSVFEGPDQNWTLTRTQSRRGSSAPRTAINTPYGILLLGYDGISFYRQGFGIDQEQPWVQEKIGDLWKGTAVTDPAQIKGRIPAINPTTIFNSCAAYKDEKIYLAVPTGSATYAQTMFILDMPRQKVWMFTYPFNILSLFWDRVSNRLMAGTDHGTIQQLEIGLTDTTDLSASPIGIAWEYQTREWSTPVDQILENLQVEGVGTSTWLADVDNTNTYTISTISSSTKAWSPGSLQGTIGDNINFLFNGTQSGTAQQINEIQWDAIPEREKVTFFQTSPLAVPSESYVKTWLVDINPLGGTCTGSVLVDGTVVQTGTFTGSQHQVFEVGLPNVTYGKNIAATYTFSTPGRYYDTNWELEPKPFGKLTWLVTYKKAGGVTQADMARFYAMDIEGSATNTITSTWIIDGTAFTTNTLTFGLSDVGEETGVVRNYMDQIPFPPGGRGYLFQQQITSETPFKVWRASLDIDRIGIKGLSRVTQNGSPS